MALTDGLRADSVAFMKRTVVMARLAPVTPMFRFPSWFTERKSPAVFSGVVTARGPRLDRHGAVRSPALECATLDHAGQPLQRPHGEQDVLGEDEVARLLAYLLNREPQPTREPRGGSRGEGGHVDDVVAVPGSVEDLAERLVFVERLRERPDKVIAIGEKAQRTRPLGDGWRLTGVVDYRHCYPAFPNVPRTIKSSNPFCNILQGSLIMASAKPATHSVHLKTLTTRLGLRMSIQRTVQEYCPTSLPADEVWPTRSEQ